jgi:hypothetical protein
VPETYQHRPSLEEVCNCQRMAARHLHISCVRRKEEVESESRGFNVTVRASEAKPNVALAHLAWRGMSYILHGQRRFLAQTIAQTEVVSYVPVARTCS